MLLAYGRDCPYRPENGLSWQWPGCWGVVLPCPLRRPPPYRLLTFTLPAQDLYLGEQTVAFLHCLRPIIQSGKPGLPLVSLHPLLRPPRLLVTLQITFCTRVVTLPSFLPVLCFPFRPVPRPRRRRPERGRGEGMSGSFCASLLMSSR